MTTPVKNRTFSREQVLTAQFARALGHPVRIAILQLLDSQTCCYHGELAEELPIAKSTLSQHLNALKEAGLIRGIQTPPSVRYCIVKENWEEARCLLSQLLGCKDLPTND